MLANKKPNAGKRSPAATGVWMLGILAAVMMLSAPLAWAEEEVVEAVEEAPVQDVTMPGATMGQSIQTITFKKDMPIKDALRMLAQMYQKNIVPSAGVDGIVTVSNLYDVTFEEALQAILGTHKYEIKGNFIKVYTSEEFMADKSRFEHAMITLHYINSDEATKLAEPLLSDNGRLGATTAAPTEMEAGKSGDTLAVNDRLVVSDYPENIERIREVLSEVDIEPVQVLLEVTVMEATLTETTKFGIDWTNLNGADVTAGFSLATQTNGVQSSFAPTLGSSDGIAVGVTFDDITSIITAVENITDVTIMANPKILALNKQAGKIIIGEEEGYLDTTSQNGTSTTQSVAFLESGTILEFRPFVGRNGMIRMEIHPEQSSGEISGSLPNKTTTEVITNVMVKDSQTIVLGGLFKEETNLTRNQVPLVGDVPVVGELFKGTNDVSTRKELIVLITPHVINTPEEADGAGRMEDVLRLASHARENLYWMSRAKIEEDRYAKAVQLYDDGQLETALAVLDCPYRIDRNYLDETRLKERIVRELHPDDKNVIERVMLRAIEKEESGKWFRR